MKALVVGGNGFIGSHLVDRLDASGWEVVVLDIQGRRYGNVPDGVHFVQGDLTQTYLLREALLGVDVVFHLAWATIHEVSNRDPAADIEANLTPTVRLLEACREAGVRRFIFVSSGGTVYGPARAVPIPESHPLEPVSGYGITKVAAEKYVALFNHLYGLEYIILRPSVPYGPRQNPLARQGAVAVFLYRVAHDLPVVIWGDGSVSRDYFYVADLVDAFLAAAQVTLNDAPRVFNIGGGRAWTLSELVAQVEETVGRPARVEYQPGRKFDAPRIKLAIDQAALHLDWHPRVTLPEGLQRTWEWMAATVRG